MWALHAIETCHERVLFFEGPWPALRGTATAAGNGGRFRGCGHAGTLIKDLSWGGLGGWNIGRVVDGAWGPLTGGADGRILHGMDVGHLRGGDVGVELMFEVELDLRTFRLGAGRRGKFSAVAFALRNTVSVGIVVLHHILGSTLSLVCNVVFNEGV